MGDKPKMLTAKEFAVETGISYPVIIGWLKEGKIPEAEQTSFKIWQIPATVAEMFKKPENRPKLGRPPKTEPKPADGGQESAKTKRKASKRLPGSKAKKGAKR